MRVAVISEPLASTLFDGRDPIGQALAVLPPEGREETYTIVGVTADFATSQLTTERPQVLLPLPQQPDTPVYLIARGAVADERALASAFESIARDLDVEYLTNPIGVFPPVVTGTALVDKSLQDVVSESIATAVVGGIVLLLASLGVLGVVAYMVAARTRELALRLALGATRLGVVRLLLIDVVKLIAPGIAIGLAVGAVLIRRLDTFMDTPLSVGPTPLGIVEPLIYAGAAVVTVALALLASWPSARRVTSIQPMMAMRSE